MTLTAGTRYGRGWLRLAPAICCTLGFAVAKAQAFDIAVCERVVLPFQIAEQCNREISGTSAAKLDAGRLYTLRGYAWLREEEPTGAVAEFSRAIVKNAANLSAIEGRARAYTVLKRYEDAVHDWTLLISARPGGEDYFRERAMAYLEMGRTREAFADYDRAIELKAGNPDSYIGRARVYQRMAMRDAAIREFDRAAAVDPTYPETYFAKAQAAESWGDADMAIKNYALVVRYKGDVWYAQRAMKRLGARFSDFEYRDAAQPKDQQR